MADEDIDSLDPPTSGLLDTIRGSLTNNAMKFFLAFIMFIILQSDIFINRVLSNVNGATMGTSVTSYGTFIQALLLALILLIFDLILDFM